MKVEGWQLKQRQSLPLEIKIERSKRIVREFYGAMDGNVYVAFSGGKDSTVLLHLIRSVFSKTPGLFVDTGLEYPEIRDFVDSTENITTIKPEKHWKKIIENYGYPVVSKVVSMSISRYRNTKDPIQKEYRLNGTKNGEYIGRSGVIPDKWKYLIDAPFKISEKCCDFIKKKPVHKYYKETGLAPFVGIMAENSNNRKIDYLKRGCNDFESKIPQSRPLGFWTDRDIWEYIKKFNIPYSKIYDMGEERTGCMFCMFGVQREEEPNRFQRMQRTHPKQWNYCINKLGLKEVLDYIGVPYEYPTTLDDFNLSDLQ